MRKIVSLRGKIYELIELPVGEIEAIVASNGYASVDRFIDRHDNWQSTITVDLKVHDSIPIRHPKYRSKPKIEKILAGKKRGRPAKKRDLAPALPGQKKKRKRRSKYGFEKIKLKGDYIFVEGAPYKVAAAAAYFGSRYEPVRKYSVHKASMDGIKGSRVEWVG